MSTNPQFSPQSVDKLAELAKTLQGVENEIAKKIVGQTKLRRRLIEVLLTNGHVLLEGVPGLAKTFSIKALAESINAHFQRIQFTPDLLPADIIGTEIYKPQTSSFEVRKGPVFTNFLLADEINRAPAKVQSALLETMQERQVTIGDTTFDLPKPFFVLATQNPVEQEGTYPLPEAQVDRFIAKIKIDYPEKDEEKEVLDRIQTENFSKELTPVANIEDISSAIDFCKQIYVDERIKRYIVDLVRSTRYPAEYGLEELAPLIELGASPRASLSLMFMSQAEAMMNGEHFVVPQNVKDIAADVLRHRLSPSYEAQAQGLDSDTLISSILDSIEVP